MDSDYGMFKTNYRINEVTAVVHEGPMFCIPQLRYWGEKEKQETAQVIRTVGNKTSVLIRDLEGSSTYYMYLQAYNSAGVGPQSIVVNVTTKKPRKLC